MITVLDDFCPQYLEAYESALGSGFGTWAPGNAALGRNHYAGVNFVGKHELLLAALARANGRPVIPGGMFFRITRPGEADPGFVHSDRSYGEKTCVVYLTESPKDQPMSGTAFFRHRNTGKAAMDSVEQMTLEGTLDQLQEDTLKGGDETWEQTAFVAGLRNRALIFDAPLFHARWPKEGYGTDDQDARCVWVCHYILG